MYKDKKVLLIGGGGTLGTYAAKELLSLGCYVDVLCPEEKVSDNKKLRFIQSYATNEFLEELFKKEHYDGIVNFVYYKTVEEYKKTHTLLINNTEHLIFISTYRVYANEEHPITEQAPRLYDVVTDKFFLENEDYAVPKAKCEDFLTKECAGENWTIVRPVISFSHRRLDLLLYTGKDVLNYAKSGETMYLPNLVKDYSAGIDWAGNSGKLIANLLFKKDALGEAFTVYSGHNLTWGEVADIYSEITGAKICWCDEEDFEEKTPKIKESQAWNWAWECDRKFNRDIDCSKIMRVTGLTPKDFASVADGIREEIKIINELSENN